jgi:hypothetical protein
MKTPFRQIVRLPEFERDIKRLVKRFRSLEEDLDIFIKTELKLFHKLGIDNKGVVRMAGLGIQDPGIYKARKFACRSLKGKGAHYMLFPFSSQAQPQWVVQNGYSPRRS